MAVPIKIDSHVHILPPKRMRGLIKWMKQIVPDHPIPQDFTGTQLVQEMKANGITHFFNLVYPIQKSETETLNRFNAAFCKQTKGAIPFASLHPDDDHKPEKAAAALEITDFAGFKFHPFIQKFDPLDAKMDSFYGFACERGKPIVFHTGFDDFYKASLPLKTFETIMKRYAGLPVVLAHSGFPYLEQAFAMLDDYPALYLDATLVAGFLRDDLAGFLPPNMTKDSVASLLAYGITNYPDRIFFGSDHPAGWGTHASIFKDLEKIPVAEKDKDTLLSSAPVEFINKFLPGFDWRNSLQDN